LVSATATGASLVPVIVMFTTVGVPGSFALCQAFAKGKAATSLVDGPG
jgi:hypothetical protein